MTRKPILWLALILVGVLWCLHSRASADMHKVVAGNTEFALDLYAKLRSGDGNLFFSPYSISTALAMAYGGAQGETANQIASTLHFDLPENELAPAFADMERRLNAIQAHGQVQLTAANSLFAGTNYKFRQSYLDLCEKYYGAPIQPLDYIGDTAGARRSINKWIDAKTNDKITDFLNPGVLTSDTRLVLVNAIYFKGNWPQRFDAGLTQDEPFQVSPKTTVTAPLMNQTTYFGYAEFPDLQVLELPYSGHEISMVVLLPGTVNGLGSLEEQLTPENLAAWTEHLKKQKVDVFMPKFKMASELSLARTLTAMGMPDAFDLQKADFSGMDGARNLYIKDVIHEADVDVDEEGTEAAAATAVTVYYLGIDDKTPSIPVFRADRPFLFLIRDNQTGSILFLGRVMDPTR